MASRLSLPTPVFADRRDAGVRLGEQVEPRLRGADAVVLGLPRGGVPVAYEVARAARAPLDVFLVRKLGAPHQPELAIGAIAAGGVRVLNDAVVRALGISTGEIEAVAAVEARELERRAAAYTGGRPPVRVAGRTVVLVDDGLATGATMRAAVRALRAASQPPREVIVAVPVGAEETCDELGDEADEVICLATPRPFYAVAPAYVDFTQTTDEEVARLLERAGRELAADTASDS